MLFILEFRGAYLDLTGCLNIFPQFIHGQKKFIAFLTMIVEDSFSDF